MRISDWSSDVCSSDLAATSQGSAAQAQRRNRHRHADRHSQDVEGGRGYRSWETLRVRCRAACENISEAPSSPPARSSRRWARLGPIPQRSPANIRGAGAPRSIGWLRSEEHTSELQSIMRITYAVFCLKKK